MDRYTLLAFSEKGELLKPLNWEDFSAIMRSRNAREALLLLMPGDNEDMKQMLRSLKTEKIIHREGFDYLTCYSLLDHIDHCVLSCVVIFDPGVNYRIIKTLEYRHHKAYIRCTINGRDFKVQEFKKSDSLIPEFLN